MSKEELLRIRKIFDDCTRGTDKPSVIIIASFCVHCRSAKLRKLRTIHGFRCLECGKTSTAEQIMMKAGQFDQEEFDRFIEEKLRQYDQSPSDKV